jgi:NADH-quinone oxidoreductase subunit M
MIFGVLEKQSLMNMFDLSRRELVLLVPLAVLAIFFGFHPGPIMDVTAASVDQLVANYNAALSAAGKLAAIAP